MAFSSSLVGKKDIILLLDDSGSIIDNDFLVMKMFSQTLISYLSAETRLAILTFHSSHSIVSVFTPKKDNLSAALEGYHRLKGSTNLVAGLEQCEIFFQSSLPKTEKLVIVVTDGVADTNPTQRANQLRNSGVEIVALGVGNNVSMDNLSKFASFRRVYHFSTFNDLLDFIKPISNKDRPHQVHLTPINVENIRTSFKKDLTIEFAVVNAGFQPLPKLDIRFSPPKGIGALKYFNDANVYVHSSIQPGGKEYVTVTFTSGGDHFASIPNAIPFKVLDLNTRIEIYCAQDEFLLSSEWFTNKFVNYQTPNPVIAPSLNILLFGIQGAGKSSFMNSILTSLLPDYCEAANIGGSTSHVTRNIRCFPIPDNVEKLGNCRINLWDTWGVDESNYRYEFLSDILQGKIPDGFEMMLANHGNNVVTPSPPMSTVHRRIHGVFMFVPIGVLEDNPMCQRIRNLIEEINKMEINTDIVITRADTIINPQIHKTQISVQFDIPENRVHLVSNYTKDTEKNFLIDKVTLEILNIMVAKCEKYIKSTLPKKIDPNYDYSSLNHGNNNNYNSFQKQQQQNQQLQQQQQQLQQQQLQQQQQQQQQLQQQQQQQLLLQQQQQLQNQGPQVGNYSVFGGYNSIVVKKISGEVILTVDKVDEQTIDQFEKFLSSRLGYVVILQRANECIFLRDIIKGGDKVVYVTEPQQFSFPPTQIFPQQNLSFNGQPQQQYLSPNNSHQYNQPQQISYSSTGQYQYTNDSHLYNQPQYNSQEVPQKYQPQVQPQIQPQQQLPPPQSIQIYQNGVVIGAIRTNVNTAVKLDEFRARIRNEIMGNDSKFIFIDEAGCPVAGPQENLYTVAQILTGNVIGISQKI